MIGLDTNVVVRFLLGDEPKQSEEAARVFQALTPSSPGFVPNMVLAETFWVLRAGARIPKERVLELLEALVKAAEIEVESPLLVRRALRDAQAGADFADALIAASCAEAGCSETVTFDKAAGSALGWRVLGDG